MFHVKPFLGDMFHVKHWSKREDYYDVIVIGAGHAGIEAANAASSLGSKTLLITMNGDQIGAMSCNPAVGGLGKSQLAREVDALGGLMCRMADKSAMQYRLLNESKGPAVRATRVHVDRHEYRALMKAVVEEKKNLSVKQGQVAKLFLDSGRVSGVETTLGQKFWAASVVVTTGTFMNGKAHIGRQSFASGRAGEQPSVGLSDFLASEGVKIGRLKTGTVPRVDLRTIDLSKTLEQPSQNCGTLSFFSIAQRKDLESAHITFTNAETHQIIRDSLDESPLYSGIIQSRGPRYCPSVEDKVVRFSDKDRHQVFLEKEGRGTQEVYVGGLSTSLPYDKQIKFLRTIPGLEQVEIIRPGYAIEYDFIDATQLSPTLEFKGLEGLYFAGQVNGTSGYEEAAAQGILAGINAAQRSLEKEQLILKRSEAYIGVLVDDLVTKPTTEPYRMFTSRAEWRLLMRQDNADIRLCELGYKLGLLSSKDFDLFEGRRQIRSNLREALVKTVLTPTRVTNDLVIEMGEAPLKLATPLSDFLRRPNVRFENVKKFVDLSSFEFSVEDEVFVETELKYEGYVKQAEAQINQLARHENLKIPDDFGFDIPGLPTEAVEKLSTIKPKTLGQASRISGITPSTISLLSMIIMRKSSNKDSCAEQKEFGVIRDS